MTSDWYGKKRLAGIGLSTLRHPITHDVSMGQEYLPSHFPLFMWPFFISCTRWQSIHGASALSKYRFHLWKSLPSWFFKQKTNTASILLKKIFGLISTSHLSITNLNLCSEILPIYVHPNHLPQNAPGCLTSHAPWLPYPKTWRPFAAFAAVFCPDLETSPDLHSCDRNWKFWLPKSKKKLPKCWFQIFHQIITTWMAWIFPGIKKIHDLFMAIYRTNQKVSVLFFSKNLDANSKKIGIHLPPKKNMFWIQFHPPLKLVGQSRRFAHAHLFGAEAWVKCLWWALLLELNPQPSLIIWAFPKLKPQSREPNLHQVKPQSRWESYTRCPGATVPRCQAMGRYTTHNTEESRNGGTELLFLGQNFRKLTSKHDPREAGARRSLNFSPPKEEMNGEEVWHMHKLTLILVHTGKERISEAFVGIVVFASVSSRSLDKDPSWTPCGRSSCGTCWIWPMHLDKLHAPRKTWKTSWWNYI